MHFIDSHVHLDASQFNEDREHVIARAREAGVKGFITIGAGYGVASAERACALSAEYLDIWATVGVHPHDAGCEVDFESLETLAERERVVAIGETGLDFYRDWAPVDLQYEKFEAQVALAKKVGKPLVIHSRAAGKECLELLIRTNAADVGGVFHCFAEDVEFAKKLLDINFIISLPGVLTFKNASHVREVAAALPLSSILLETDAPYLAPEPHRGQRCESAFLPITARKLAEVRNISLEDVAHATTESTCKLFGITLS
jgi:TatD DNase family protein